MIPDAVLSAFIEVKNAREATKEIGRVQDALRAARDEAVLATNAVNRFGRTRGIAVLDVDSAKARAQVAEAQKAVQDFDSTRGMATATVNATVAFRTLDSATNQVRQFSRENASATLSADAGRVRLVTAEATREVRAFGAMKATAVLDADTRKLGAMAGEVKRAGREVGGLSSSFDGLHTSKSKTDTLIDRNVGTFGKLSQAIRGTSSATGSMRGNLGPLSGGLGVVATGALFFGTALLAIVGPAIAVTAALGPLVGLAAGVAGGLVAAAQGFGVFKLATMGVGDALKEQTKLSAGAGGAAASQAGQEVAAARAIEGAQEGVRSARQATAQASRALSEATRTERQAIDALGPAYTEARVRLRDMRDAVIGTNLSLKDARFAAQDARKALADLLGGPSPRVLADAHVALADAMRGERSAAEGLADAHKALNQLLAPPDVLSLADAHDAIADATRGETRSALDLAAAQERLAQITLPPANDIQRAQAALDLQKAQAALNGVNKNAAATDIERRQAALNLAKAQAKVAAINAAPANEADIAKAKLDVADAENAVGDAARASARAQQALSNLEAPAAQDEVAKARGRVKDAEAAVASAKRGTLDAQAALAKLESPPASDDLARARLALAQAEQAVSTATKDSVRAAREYGAAEALGIARSPSVLAARESVRSATLAAADAERALANAQRAEAIAAKGVSEAQADAARGSVVAAAAVEKLSTKFDELPPAAQAFVRVLQSLKPKLAELRESAAAGFFPGATAGLQAASGSFGAIKKVVGETAVVLGDAAKKSGELVGSPAFGKDIQTIGGNNAKVIGTLGEALRHVISAFRHVLVAAGPLTQWLADVANKWALNAAEAAKAGRESGKLAEFFEKTKAVAQRLGSIIGHLTGGLMGVGKVGAVSGNEILASIDRAAERFDEWANSVKGQNSIREFFQKTKEIAAGLLSVLAGLTAGFTALALGLLPVVAVLKLLAPLADEAVIAFVAYKLAISATSVSLGIYNLLTTAAIRNQIAWRASLLVAAAATGAQTAAQWLLNAALTANPIGLVIAGLVALVAGLVIAYKQSETFRAIVDGALRAVAAAFGWMWDAAQAVFGWLSANWGKVTAILTGPIGAAVTAIRAFGPQMLAAATWLLTQFVAGVTAMAAAVKAVGGWIVNRVAEGIKAVAGFAADVGGWLKNRVVEGIHASVDGFKGVGGWIVNRIADGFKVVGEALASVGGWLKNRVVELVHLAVDGFTGLGGWVLNRIVDGLKTLTDGLKSVGGWLKNRIGEALEAVKDGFLDVGGNIMGWIVDGLKGGANLLVKFVNKIIDVINKIPGVDIGAIKGFAEGGVHAKGATGGGPNGTGRLARGGAFGMTGGLVNHPITLMGEEAPRHPEFVIPTNPAYRDRAQMLLGQAAGAIGLAEGGVVSAFRGAIDRTNASPKSSLALWMAGIVESGLRNLKGYTDLDSQGALQVRDGTARGMGINNLDPFACAMAFLTRGFWGKGSAMQLAARNPGSTAGWVAQQTQGSAYPDRYDAVRAQALPYLKGGGGDDGGGILGAISGAAGAVSGALGDLLSKGAGFLLDQLPGVGSLPDFLKGTGKYAVGKAGEYIKDKVSGLIGLDGGEGAVGGGVTGSVQGAMALARQMGLAITSTTGGQHAKNSYHYKGRAADVAGSAGQMGEYFNAALDRYGKNLLELFYDPLGAIKNGQRIGAIGGHSDHVHIALAEGGLYGGSGLLGSFQTGGTVPQTGPYLLHRNETVTPAGASDDGRGRGNVIVEGDLIVKNQQDAEVAASRLAFKLRYAT